LRRLLEGVRIIDPNILKNKKLPVHDSVNSFFNDIDCQVLYEIDEFNKVIKYSYKRKFSEDSGDISANSANNESSMGRKTHTMLINY
jgi:hypothetical protein